MNQDKIKRWLTLLWPHTVLPLTHSVARELEAMADPHPNVLNLASIILPSSSTLICKRTDIYILGQLTYNFIHGITVTVYIE